MLELYDYTDVEQRHGLTYDHWRARVHPPIPSCWKHDCSRPSGAKATFDMTFRIIKRSGKTLHIHAKAQIERDDAGHAVSVLGTNRDITAQLEQEARLREAKEQADAANQAKSAFWPI
ncbi:PAS domain-containing protein [Halopseudomonas pachastrellae]|nr:PAS domain-containing protein [Halopseudomonas pachastrellae]